VARATPLLKRVMPKRVINPKLSPEEEEALLKSLRTQRESKAKGLLQAEAQAVARKLVDVAIDKVPEEAAPLVNKDKKNFGAGDATNAVIAITLNAVLLSASAPEEEDTNGKGAKKKGAGKGGGGKKNAKPKIGAKVERLPPPTGEAATEAIIKHKATLVRVSQAKDAKEGQQSLMLAFESWLCNEYNELVLPATPQLLTALRDEGLLDKEMLSDYWGKVLSTRDSDEEERKAAKADCEEAEVELTAANDELKKAQKEDADAAQQAKWAATEVLNARTGNQPTADEVAREKAASTADKKARDDKLTKLKNVELFHKRQVSALNANEAANKNLADKISQARTCVLMHKYGQSFFEPGADSKVSAPDKAVKVENEAEIKSAA